MAQKVVGMDGVTEDRAATFTLPGAAPGNVVVARATVPVNFRACHIGFASKSGVDEGAQLP
ncbi:hypothetical protein D3C87_1634550 [compost metagenome]